MAIATERTLKREQAALLWTAARKRTLRRRLLAWYDAHARELPWRQSQDPYRVWISEVMLQQTQVATVRDYFTRFVRALPDVRRLAAADEREVLRLWEGLGYYRRARQLHACARQIVSEHGGQFPRSADALQALPGIGRYTAGAIASIAFGERAPILEANTIRLLSRLLAYRENPLAAKGQRVLWQLAEEILPRKDVARFNQALMELGSLVCTPSEPRCHECPLAGMCAARLAGAQADIPVRKARAAMTELCEAAVVVRRNGSVLMRQCAPGERWAGLWDFPRFALQAEGPLFAEKEVVAKLREQSGVTCARPVLLATIRHGVTRYRITLHCYEAAYRAGRIRAPRGGVVRWHPLDKLGELPLSTTGRKICKHAGR